MLSPVSKSLRFLWLGKINNQYASVVLLSSKLNSARLRQIVATMPAVAYVNKADEISSIFNNYRIRISYLLACAYALLLLLLMWRYSWRRAFLYFLPAASASLLSLAMLGWLQVPLTLFNILALFLVLGIGVDYVLFFAETRSSYQITMLAVTLSAITTVLSFGLLSLSSTPAIHYFGLTVLIGISSAYLLAPLVARCQQERSYET